VHSQGREVKEGLELLLLCLHSWEAESNECRRCRSAPSPLTPQANSQGMVPPTVDKSSHLNWCNQNSPPQGCSVDFLAGFFSRFCKVDNWHIHIGTQGLWSLAKVLGEGQQQKNIRMPVTITERSWVNDLSFFNPDPRCLITFPVFCAVFFWGLICVGLCAQIQIRQGRD